MICSKQDCYTDDQCGHVAVMLSVWLGHPACVQEQFMLHASMSRKRAALVRCLTKHTKLQCTGR